MSSQPSEIDTGVSNGDVDWLFRGKSKKLTKKLNSDRRSSVSGPDGDSRPSETKKTEKSEVAKSSSKPSLDTVDESKQRENISRSASDSASKSANHATSESKSPSFQSEVKQSKSKTQTEGISTSGQGQTTPKNATKNADETKSETNLFRLGRSRSSSAPQPPDAVHGGLKKKASMGSLPSSSGNSSTDRSETSSVSRSNSGKGKSFFSSLSSKFKSSSSSSQTSSHASSPPPPKVNHNILGPSSHHSSKEQDLCAVSRPPADIGISISKSSRRSSVSSSPKSSIEKERGSFFKRRPSVSEPKANQPQQSVKLNVNPRRQKLALSEIQEPMLRRVSFALDELHDDPQQQIPSRKPRKGNVLIAEDIKAPIPRLSQGITAGEGKTPIPETRYTDAEIQTAIEIQKRNRLEAEKHAMEAHLSAKKLAAQITQFKTSSKSDPAIMDEEDDVHAEAEQIEIDKPLHVHEHHFHDDLQEEDANKELPLETVYTRCCHLREILPIPATLKQLKNKTRPLQVLKLLNPKPTLIDVLSFSDFIAITPINTVIFDNVTMSTEMLKHLLAALVNNKHLEKLSFRNVAIDEKGWLYLCEFLSRTTTVKKLDISQQKVRHLTKQTSFRSAMNWDMFIRALIARGGIEELVMGGCKLSDETFENLLENALTISTCRLGMAATEINVRKCEMIADWISRPNSKCVGIDVAFNDLSQGQLRPFIEVFNTKPVNLIFFSLNSTNLSDVLEVGELLRGLTNVKTLKFLDLSSLPQLFPGVISKLDKYLPQFACLKRVHFDLNELAPRSISAIADILPKVSGLVHVSLLGNRNLTRSAIASLYAAVKSSAIYTLDLDQDLVPDELSQRLALYLMRNMDRTIRPDITNNKDSQDDVMFDGSLLMEAAEKMLIESDKNSGETDIKLQKIITNALIERTNAVRKEIHRIIDNLFQKRNQGNLSFEGKETLLRFCLLDASLEKVVHMFEQKAKMMSSAMVSPSPSVHTNSLTDNGIMDGTFSAKDDHDQLHESSSALIDAGPILMAKTTRFDQGPVYNPTFEPHSVVVEPRSDGSTVPIDNLTGRPVLMKSVSQTSVHAKEQELEEGEFHRWGYFMEHRNDDESKLSEKPVFGTVPSGSELREAIIDAKGIESVTELISKIGSHRVSLENIYKVDDSSQPQTDGTNTLKDADVFEDAFEQTTSEVDDIGSIDSNADHDVHPVVDEAYDKLLNEAERVRSNK
ncbi:putative HMG2-induced ER-remodeling protein [Clavispora lusitaniae]|uniref:Uncharacterized protein n=2 Tax=Clavispora lusitaniae TaxID=36911 RepID=C4Y474_CLAL4|nr:uncharacterized protein CLUG_02446 [Clavispora lusitaniae ATCC 42720]KAF7580280.1 hypothetical protein FOB63_005350 [Clavispora lusitaniae]EEQ38320.1 hypothetical protein CLUG_02446 [Clavispora lusitaniae ATCC 42720]QFZ27845.1 putative HMG2-induced ER-remodeling protein [Clavispora lusitaniae]QFZ32848.1 putative HMG2-induced ER-remodeling protein [Clavispora lusitaniae]QFZ38518.1 putative HMG2-induced ER-remodeling protein [Clavispora lusitaniae]